MFNSLKSTWWIFLLIIAGGIIYFLSLHPSNPKTDQGVVLSDIFHQQQVAAPAVMVVAPKADPVPPLAIVTSPVDGHEAGFTIQVYSFQDRNRAQGALQGLKNNGYQAFLI